MLIPLKRACDPTVQQISLLIAKNLQKRTDRMFERFIHKIVGIFPECIQKLYYKYEAALLYIFFGGLTTLISVGTQFIAYAIGLGTAASTTVSWIFAVLFAFFTNKVFVFGSKSFEKKLFLREFVSFIGARFCSYLIELGFMVLTVDVLLWNKFIMKLTAQVFVLVLNYIFSKFIIFRKGKKEKKEEEEKEVD